MIQLAYSTQNRNTVYEGIKGTTGPARQRILDALDANRGGLTREELSEQLKMPYTTVSARVSDLQTDGLVKSIETKRMTKYGKPATLVVRTEKPSPKAEEPKSLCDELVAYIRKNPPASKWEIAAELASLGAAGAPWPKASATQWKAEINQMIARGDLVEVNNTVRLPEQESVPTGQLSLF